MRSVAKLTCKNDVTRLNAMTGDPWSAFEICASCIPQVPQVKQGIPMTWFKDQLSQIMWEEENLPWPF